MAKVKEPDSTADREIVIKRLLNAPRDLVFSVWTDPLHIAEWWGPDGFTNTIHSMDVRPGGVWKFMMHGPDGTDYPNRIDYTEVVRPSKISYLHGSGDPTNSDQFEGIITFEDHGQRTLITMRVIFKTKEERDMKVEKVGAIEGGNQTLNRLETFLKKIQA